jgi:hypothetical protein
MTAALLTIAYDGPWCRVSIFREGKPFTEPEVFSFSRDVKAVARNLHVIAERLCPGVAWEAVPVQGKEPTISCNCHECGRCPECGG